MQQVMDMMQGLQEAMAASKVEQECMQANLATSEARNEVLCRTNEELRRELRNNSGLRDADEASVSLHQGSFLCRSRSRSWRR